MTDAPATFVVESVFVIKDRGPVICRSKEAAEMWPGRGEPGCLVLGDRLECGELAAYIGGIEYFLIEGPQPQQALLLGGVEQEQVAVGQVWTRPATAPTG